MSITRPPELHVSAGEPETYREAGGLRVLGTRALHVFGEIRYKQFARTHITVGRARQRDIRVRDPSVSRHHCTIVRADDGGWVMIDVGARAGVLVREPGSRLERVYQVRLVVGMHVRLGSVSLLVIATSQSTRALAFAPSLAGVVKVAISDPRSHRIRIDCLAPRQRASSKNPPASAHRSPAGAPSTPSLPASRAQRTSAWATRAGTSADAALDASVETGCLGEVLLAQETAPSSATATAGAPAIRDTVWPICRPPSAPRTCTGRSRSLPATSA
jgi:predicted component of type VI protein secretion system